MKKAASSKRTRVFDNAAYSNGNSAPPHEVTFGWEENDTGDLLGVLADHNIGMQIHAGGITVEVADDFSEAQCRAAVKAEIAQRQKNRLQHKPLNWRPT